MAIDHKFEVNPTLTGLSLCYKNPTYNFIADLILPRTKVDSESFKYNKYPFNSFLRVPNTEIGEKGEPKGVGLDCETITESVKYYATREIVPQASVEAATDGIDPIKDNAELVTNTLALAREKRTAELFQNAANYGTNTLTLTSNEQINEKSSKILLTIQDIRKSMKIKPNCAIMTENALMALQTHPDFTTGYNSNASDRGLAPIDYVKSLLKIKDLYIGDVEIDFAKDGLTPNVQNVWKDSNIIFFYKNPDATPKAGITFGYTAEFGSRAISTYFDPDPGVSGVTKIKGAEKLIELIVAPECGFLLKNCIGT